MSAPHLTLAVRFLLTGTIRSGTDRTMSRRSQPKAVVRGPLTALENDVMAAVWQGGPSAVEGVHAVVSGRRQLKEATVRTLLRRLEEKGYLRHEIEGRAYVYRAVEPARSLAARAVRQIIDRFCRGSIEELLSGMVEAKALSDTELKALEQSIRDQRRATARQDI